MWVVLGIISAILLGVYELFKKISLHQNAVLPVLCISTLFSASLFVPLLILSRLHPDCSHEFWFIPHQSFKAHLFFLLKAVIVGTSWVLSYFAVKHLPMTIASPIRASGPLWTLVGALLIYGEQMNLIQWSGILVTMSFYFGLSLTGKKEGISFRKNKWVLFMTLATIIASTSGLLDKYLLTHFDRMAMQCWSYLYLAPINIILLLLFYLPFKEKSGPFQWRFSILLIGLTLTAADFAYFKALSTPGALIAILSTVRRSNAIVSFSLAAMFFQEKNIKEKGLLLLGILFGILLILFGTK